MNANRLSMINNIEYKSRKEINDLKLKLVNKNLAYLRKNSPYYKKSLSGTEFIQIDTLAELEKLPITTKEDLAKHNDNFLCVPKNEIADWITTSGTLGKPVTFGLTKADLRRLARNEARSLAISACQPSDRIQLMVTLDKRFMAGLAYYLGAQEYGCSTIRVGSGSPGLQIDSIGRFEPNVLIAVPSFLLVILDFASEIQIQLINKLIEKVICIGEPIRRSNHSLNNLGSRIKEKMPSVNLISTYASTEMATAITECSYGKGGHIPADLIHIELTDSEGKQVPDGKPGEVTITTFGVEGMPLLRYKTGDVCTMINEECDCINKTQKLSPVLVRKKQMIKYKGTTFYPEAIYEVLNGSDWVTAYIIQLSTNDIGTDEVTVCVSLSDGLESVAATEKLSLILQTNLRVKLKIKIMTKEEVMKLRFVPGMRKPIKLVDNRGITLSKY